uniref:PARP catalytic domain-containing protein n=1 Tax=Psilocybe cubensis TaxID=181762 RepID=A0A8H8CFW5_PSICU
MPTVKKIYKIIEDKNFLLPYDRYKKTIGNEVFRYHGTTKKCTLGDAGNTKLCANTTCSLCCILRTSFKTSLANPSGAFGAGVYSSSASNKAFSYTSNGTGAILLSKVVLGNVRTVNQWNEVMSCPPGFNSVVFDRQNGTLNETIVYTDDAIRPVFLLIF